MSTVQLPKPVLRDLVIDDLVVDAVVQRRYDQLHAKRIAKDFDPNRLRTFTVSRRGDGSYVIIDGQHRWAAARLADKGQLTVACEVYTGLSTEQEAHLFVVSNSMSKRPTPYDTFSKRVLAGDPIAVKIDHIVQANQLEIVAPGGQSSNSPDRIVAVATLEWIYTRGGADVLDRTLTFLRAAWPGDPTAWDGTILKAVATILLRAEGIDLVSFAEKLQRAGTPPMMIGKARDLQSALRMSAVNCMVKVLIGIYNHKRSVHRIDL